MTSSLQRFAEILKKKQNRDGSWDGVVKNLDVLTEQDIKRHRLVYTSQILRTSAALGLNEYEFVAAGVHFLDSTNDCDPLYDLALKFHPYWDLALQSKAMYVAQSLATLVPGSGSVQFSGRADHMTFEHLLTAEILLTSLQVPSSSSKLISNALTRLSRFIDALHAEQFDIADDPSHWLWAVYILSQAHFPPSEEKVRAIIDRIAKLRGSQPLWRGTTFRQQNNLAPFTQAPEVITSHVIYNLARMRSVLTASEVENLITTPALVLCSKPISTIWEGMPEGSTTKCQDLYVHSLCWRAVLHSAQLLSSDPLSSMIDQNTGVSVPALWKSAVLSRDISVSPRREEDIQAILELLTSLERSIERVGATTESIQTALAEARSHARRGALELSIPLVPQLLRYKLELKI